MRVASARRGSRADKPVLFTAMSQISSKNGRGNVNELAVKGGRQACAPLRGARAPPPHRRPII